MATATTSSLTNCRPPLYLKPPFSHHQLLATRRPLVTFTTKIRPLPPRRIAGKNECVYLRACLACGASRRNSPTTTAAEKGDDGNVRRVLQSILWAAEGVYILWLFLLPYAPGDPVWAISSETVNSLVGLSLNFFFILPLMNSAFLIPYMAIRLNEADAQSTPKKPSQLGSVMTKGAPIVGLVGGAICLLSTWWAIFGRSDGNFGDLATRWNFLKSKVGLVNYLRFAPVVGLVVYLLCLNLDEEL
ncbi:hypothetical protein Vadar_021449 [Vaccinium darrowii]|uniref:Uncharacterized protein n=1 Tax=Vaccinium darrowii TaxID=229202 RepID=A0ACB7XJS6_9ERIC|nr:hypothetical protein Vadar_021449 [Vaccinium darrowii]